MGRVFESIKAAVRAERIVIGTHADDMFRERAIVAWQVVTGALEGRLLLERPRDKPNPIAEVEQRLADGTPFKAVWAYVRIHRVAKLVTVHFFDE